MLLIQVWTNSPEGSDPEIKSYFYLVLDDAISLMWFHG